MGAGRRGAGREKLGFVGERGGEWGNFGRGGEGIPRVSGRGSGGSCLVVGEGVEGNFGRGKFWWRENFGVGGKSFWVWV